MERFGEGRQFWTLWLPATAGAAGGVDGGGGGGRGGSSSSLLLRPQPAPASLREGQEIKKLQRDKHVEMEMKPKCQAKSELSIPIYVYGRFFHWI